MEKIKQGADEKIWQLADKKKLYRGADETNQAVC